MKFLLLILTTLVYSVSPLINAAEMKIYHWVDEDGNTHFSDTAVPGTPELDVKNNNLLTTEKNDNQTGSIANQLPMSGDEDEIINYQATIVSPENDQPLRSNEGTIDVHVITEPEKKNNQKFQLYLDGQKLGTPQISPSMRALNIDRGTHQVQVELLDEDGSMLAKTQVVTVHLQRVGKR